MPASPSSEATDVEAWLSGLAAERGLSARTLMAYRRDLAVLHGLAAGEPWSRIGEPQVRAWVASRMRAGASPRSIARTLSAWRGFFDALAQAGEVASNPVRSLRAPRARKRLPKALSPDQALQLVVPTPDAPAEGFEALRDEAMIELLYSSGLRLSELTSLDVRYFEAPDYRSVSWLDLAEAQVTVLGKGGKRRTVPVGRAAIEALGRWLAGREAWLTERADADSRPLFLSARGRRLAGRTVQARLAAFARRRGIPAQVHPHVLRHSFASHLLQSSGDLRAVQELLGHANITTTQVYTALDFQRLAEVYDAAHPRARRARTAAAAPVAARSPRR
jgi:integrase/recombinase XerC